MFARSNVLIFVRETVVVKQDGQDMLPNVELSRCRLGRALERRTLRDGDVQRQLGAGVLHPRRLGEHVQQLQEAAARLDSVLGQAVAKR